MSIKIAELLAFVETVKEREEQKKLARKPLANLLLPESLEMPELERSEKPKRGRKKKTQTNQSIASSSSSVVP
jgi:hypothetical protein